MTRPWHRRPLRKKNFRRWWISMDILCVSVAQAILNLISYTFWRSYRNSSMRMRRTISTVDQRNDYVHLGLETGNSQGRVDHAHQSRIAHSRFPILVRGLNVDMTRVRTPRSICESHT
ncbi:hypothetical protein K443DRAFT_278244 [Laccaria amethystina LaAM-08-1]|uniref:Uncharacterized protein n=1 Tax=Laccaria amethystina LaAM-08-1 TaxID=1095629 RepID=A0A0C9YDX1_9AGAR|nr:hypothetical protein K443DRAFT_278244 [Laccaria amethystina LaAM-08-1]